MANGRLTFESLLDSATITSNSEASSALGDDNVVNDHIGKKWRTSGDTSEWIKFDMGSAQQITCFGVFGHNFTSAATVTLEMNATDSWGSPSYSQALTIVSDQNSNVIPQIVFYLDQTYRWVRLTIADAANSDTYIEIGRIYGGAYYEFPVNFKDGVQRTYVDPSVPQETLGGQKYFRQKNPYWVYSIAFNLIERTQMEKLESIMREKGKVNTFILSLDPDNYPTKDSILCYQTSDLQISYQMRIGSSVYSNIDIYSFEEAR